jgi:hypothetical protein
VIRLHRTPGAVTVVSRLARPRVLAVVGGALAAIALASARAAPRVAAAAGTAAVLVVLLGARALRARFERGHLVLRPAAPFLRTERRALAGFTAVRVETFAEARRRRSERLARSFAERSGAPMPTWLRAPDAPAVNDGLRRIVLVAGDGEPFPVTAWLAAEDDLEPARSAIQGLLG